MPPPPSQDLFDTLPVAARLSIRQIEAVAAQVALLDARVAELEVELEPNSSNSSRPPSSDGPHHERAVPRAKSQRRRGGQPGHKKHDRVILSPDQISNHKPSRCRRGHSPLSGDDPDPLIDQVIGLPEVLRHVTHHRRHPLVCPRCQARITAESVPEAARGFGPTLRATAYLSGVGRLGKRAIVSLYPDLCKIPMATGSVSALEARTGAALRPIHDEAADQARGLDADGDETGWKRGSKKARLRVAVTKSWTAFLIRRHRDRAAFDDLVGPTPGVLTTDRFGVYTHLRDQRRQVCWAHLRRDFRAMIDRRDQGSGIGEELPMDADILAESWAKVRDGTQTRAWFGREILPWLRAEARQLLDAGSRCGGVRSAAACRELLAIEVSLWTFASRPGVEPTNNAADRGVRHALCRRKTSYGTDSEGGSRFVERMLSAVASCRSQGRDVMDFLKRAITTCHDQSGKPSLLPDGA